MTSFINNQKKWKHFNKVPLGPRVREELLFQTGAPELVVQKGELWALEGRYYIITPKKKGNKSLIGNNNKTSPSLKHQSYWLGKSKNLALNNLFQLFLSDSISFSQQKLDNPIIK